MRWKGFRWATWYGFLDHYHDACSRRDAILIRSAILILFDTSSAAQANHFTYATHKYRYQAIVI